MNCKTRAFLVAFISLFLVAVASAHSGVKPLPFDSAICYGQLENGLTYYIRHNAQPEQRAEFYLVQSTGSLHEDEYQRGLAHVLEHMAFNGTTHFPRQEIDRYLERIGLKSGENLNAYTAFDETVYMIMNAPTTRPGIIDSCLLILRDISADLLLEDAAVEKERAVIREEWRSGRDASARIRELQYPVLLSGSRYAERLPIGRIEVIESFKPDDLRAYYKKWYRPDKQAVIVVGDLDTTYVKEKLTELFGGIPKPHNSVEQVDRTLPDAGHPTVSIAKDKEAPGYVVNLFYKHDRMPDSIYASVQGIKKDYLQTVAATLLNERLDLLLYEADPPFVFAESSDGDYMGTKSKAAWSIAAIAEEGKIGSTLEALVREAERVKRYGFSETEYERVKINVLKYYESLYLERDSEESSVYASSYIAHFTQGGYLPDMATEYEWVQRIAEETLVEDVNRHAREILDNKNVIIAVTGPDKDEASLYPDEASLLEVFNQVANMDLTPYEEEENARPLLASRPMPGKIVRIEPDTLFQAVVFTLDNGVRVVAKQTAFKEDEVLISGTSPGGNTLFADKDLANRKVLMDVVPLGGLGEHSAVELNRILAGKYVSCSATIDENSESVGGYSSVSDLRTLFELIYLHFTAPRMDEEAFSSYRNRIAAQLKNLDLNPMVAFGDSLTTALFGDNRKVKRINEAELATLDYPRIIEMYKERFADASDFVFTVVGNFSMDSLMLLATDYLAALPTIHRLEKGNEQALVPYQTGEKRIRFCKEMETPMASAVHFYHSRTDYSLKNLLATNVLTQLLDLVYMEKVRKDEGGSYGVSSIARIASFPEGRTSLQIYYDTDPDKLDRINEIVLGELHRIASDAPSEEDLAKIKENLMKTHQENQTSNVYWLSAIDNYYFCGFDVVSGYLETLSSLTPAYIRDFTQSLLAPGNHIEIILLPR